MLLVTAPSPARTRRELRTGGRLLAAAAGGLAAAAAFPPIGAWPLTFPAVAALILATRDQRARSGALAGFVFGMAFLLPLLSWVRVVGPDAWVALCLLESAFYAALGAGLALTSRLRLWPLVAAALWVAAEAGRATMPFGGFPWGRLAFAHTSSPLTGYAAFGGAPLVTFAAALAGSLLAAAVLAVAGLTMARVAGGREVPEGQRRLGSVRRAALAATGLAGVAALLAGGAAVPVATGGPRSVDVALVQGNVPRPGLDFLGRPRAVLSNHVQATERFARRLDATGAPSPQLVVWPENSSDLDPFTQPEAYALIEQAVRAVGAPTLVGAVTDGPSPHLAFNTGIVWSPTTGPGARYVKRHPVPFGEYVPFRAELTPYVDRLSRIPRDFAAGDRPGLLRVGPALVGDAICFEVAYDSLMADLARGGAQLLVVQTNNATYGRTGQPEQQLAMSRLRAVEHGRAVLVAATSGISAVIAPDGRLVDVSDEFTADVLTASVPLRDELTVADRVGQTPEWALTGLGLLAVVFGGLGRRRAGRAAASGDAGAPGVAR